MTEDKNRKQKIREIREGFNDSESLDSRKILGIVGTALIVVMFAAFLFSNASDRDKDQKVQRPDIEGEWVQLNLTEFSPEPLRPTIQREDGIRLHNSADHTFEVSFDRDISNVTLESGETAYVDIDSITYYWADPVQEEERLVKGSIYVDG